jgi:hypothetical protein
MREGGNDSGDGWRFRVEGSDSEHVLVRRGAGDLRERTRRRLGEVTRRVDSGARVHLSAVVDSDGDGAGFVELKT